MKRETPTLVVLNRSSFEVKLSKEEDLVFFDEKVQIKDIDFSARGMYAENFFKQLSSYARTEKLLKDLDEEERKLAASRHS